MKTSDRGYESIVRSLLGQPAIIGVSGHRGRSDFLCFSTESGSPQLYQVSDSGLERLTAEEAPTLGATALHPSRAFAAFARDSGGDMNYTVHLLDLNAGTSELITPRPIGRILQLFWRGDEAWIAVGSDDREVYAKLIRRESEPHNLFVSEQHIFRSAYDDRRDQLVLAVGRGRGTRLCRLKLLADPPKVEWLPHDPNAEESIPAIDADTGRLASVVSGPGGQAFIRIRSLDTLEEGSRVEIPPDVGDIEFMSGVLQWLDGETLFVVSTAQARITPRLLSLKESYWSEPLIAGSVWGSALTSDGPIWIGTSFTQPPRLEGLRNGRVTPLLATETSPFEGDLQVEDIRYASFDGREIQGWLLRTPQADAPLVVSCHGGPNHITGNWWDPFAVALTKAGYHVFAPNFRGSISFGAEFRDLVVGDVGGGELLDVLYGARYVSKRLGQTQLPAILGPSYGGYLTTMSLTTQPDEWAGGVAIVPPVDLAANYELGNAHYKAFHRHFLGGTPEDKPELYRERSPITHIEKLRQPLLIIHGENDPVCPIEPVKQFAARAEALKLPVELVINEDEGHGTLRQETGVQMMVQALHFLDRIFQSANS